jgi:hypothetical protein
MAEADPNNPGYDVNGDPLVKGVISATGVAVGSYLSGNTDSARAARLQEAMTRAAEQAHADGLTDPDEIRARVLAARDSV